MTPSCAPSLNGKVWQVPERAATCDSLEALCAVLERRYLVDQNHPLHAAEGLLHVERAALRIAHAMERNEQVLLLGDYDVDGLCGATILHETMCERWPDRANRVHVFIPDRFRDGYGLQTSLVESIVKGGITLVITIDNGISANGAIDQLLQRGVQTVVLDHHLPPAQLPPAFAIVNPNQTTCDYPSKRSAAQGLHGRWPKC